MRTGFAAAGAAFVLVTFVSGCGGSSHGAKTAAEIPDGYPGFGYTNRLYVGTLTAKDSAGHTTTGPIGVTVSADGSVVGGYGIVADAATAATPDPIFYGYVVEKDPAFRSIINAPLSPLSEDTGTATVAQSGKNLALRFTGDDGLDGTVNATLDTPDLTPGRPPAGAYSGVEYDRTGQTGALSSSGPAKGTIAADGTFDFSYVLGINRGGEMRGRIASDGTISDLVVLNGPNEIDYSGSVFKAYGTAQNLTIIVRPSFNDGIYPSYRMVRTGA